MTAATGPDIQSTSLGDSLDLHPKVKAAIEREVNRCLAKLATCSPDDLRAVQSRLSAFREVLLLPVSIKRTERERQARGEPETQPEDYAV
jgi:hypothetical protein